jgi:hypothetical protein
MSSVTNVDDQGTKLIFSVVGVGVELGLVVGVGDGLAEDVGVGLGLCVGVDWEIN